MATDLLWTMTAVPDSGERKTHMPMISSIATSTIGSALRRAGLAVLKFLTGDDGAPARYRPEAHYMRGPGPKWYEKHLDHSG